MLMRIATVFGALLIILSPILGFQSLSWSRNRYLTSSRAHESDEPVHVEVSYEGRSCEIDVNPDETILAALERNSVMDQLCLPSVPADCRRGNCMTCTGRLLSGTVDRGEDGLSPHVSELVESSDYILTCCSHAVRDGTQIELGVNDMAWMEFYKNRFVSEQAEQEKWETVARLLRLTAENNVPRWTAKTEEVLQKSSDEELIE